MEVKLLANTLPPHIQRQVRSLRLWTLAWSQRQLLRCLLRKLLLLPPCRNPACPQQDFLQRPQHSPQLPLRRSHLWHRQLQGSAQHQAMTAEQRIAVMPTKAALA